jgi:EpsI family protein
MKDANRSAVWWARFLIVWLVLAGTALLLHARSSFEVIPNRQALDAFPHDLHGWSGKDLQLTPDVLRILGPGDFLSRSYGNAANPETVDLFIAYYASQRSGDTIHSPQNCLPGAGWTPLLKDHIQIPRANGTGKAIAVTANRYVLAKGMDRVLVLYWYQAHGRTTPSEYWAKFYLVKDAIAMNRSDGAMVRVAAQIPNPSAEPQTEATALEFSKLVLTKLDDFIPQ